MPNEWFAIRTKSNREYVVAEALAGKGYEVLFPRYSVRASAGPLFPGYLFCMSSII
jgi:hypothetical protein